MIAGGTRTPEEIGRLRKARGGIWPLVRWIRRRRPFLTAPIVLGALAASLWMQAEPADLLDPTGSWRFWIAWPLMLGGVGVRLWGAGNLHKNREITSSGVYRLVRHPLYLGSLALFLAYFLTVGDPLVGLALFLVLLGAVYLPTMLAEEEFLMLKFPDQFAEYRPPPRLVPDPRRVREALETDRFRWSAAYRNLGFRTVWFLAALPAFLEIMRRY